MSTDLGPVGEVDGARWREVMGLTPDEHPVAVIVEGTWWREERTRSRLDRLERPRELGVPDVFVGSWRERHLLYACPYGAPRTAEFVHIGVLVGASLAVQLGSCGVIGEAVRPGDVIVAERALGLDGTSAMYSTQAEVMASPGPSARAAAGLQARGVTTHTGPCVTWPTLFNQPLRRVREWRRAGYLGVDMETAATLAVASRFGAAAVSMLAAWDEVLSGRSFLDPLATTDKAAFRFAEDAAYEVALEMIGEL